eukprot:UN07547
MSNQGTKRTLESILDDNDADAPAKKRRKLHIESLSEDENDEIEIDNMASLTMEETDKLNKNGYCVVNNSFDQKQKLYLVEGYVRNHFNDIGMTKDLMKEINNYFGARFNSNKYVKLVMNNITDAYFVVPKINTKLSEFLWQLVDCDAQRIDLGDNVIGNELEIILQYLGHHKGVVALANTK